MIKVQDAKNQIYVGTGELNMIISDLRDSAGMALAADIFSPIDFPDFPQSAMDGYGVFLHDDQSDFTFQLAGEAQAGNIEFNHPVKPGEAVRIFTGAKIPEGVNTVIQQEWIEQDGKMIRLKDFAVNKGMNIRKPGSQTQLGELVLKKGSGLNPAAASLLAGLGFAQVSVIRKPRIIILNTGKELIDPGKHIQSGQAQSACPENPYVRRTVLQSRAEQQPQPGKQSSHRRNAREQVEGMSPRNGCVPLSRSRMP